jgi:endoglucanase
MMLRIIKAYVFTTLGVVLFGAAFVAAAEPNTSSAKPDPFKINMLLGRGLNLGNALEAPVEGQWGVVLKEEYFSIIKQAGFNSIRLPVRWSGHALAEKPYTINPEFFQRVD